MKKLCRRESYNGQNFRALSRLFCFFSWLLASVIYAEQKPLNEVMALDLPKIKALRENLEDHQVRIYNKVGYVYGTLTDIAYIEDKVNKLAFFLAGTILVNKNETFNDDNYEFEETGIPFLADGWRQSFILI